MAEDILVLMTLWQIRAQGAPTDHVSIQTKPTHENTNSLVTFSSYWLTQQQVSCRNSGNVGKMSSTKMPQKHCESRDFGASEASNYPPGMLQQRHSLSRLKKKLAFWIVHSRDTDGKPGNKMSS